MRARPTRTARLVGPSADGRSIVVVTEDDEQLEVRVDTRLREAVTPRNDGGAQRPKQGQLEIQMESALRPREIQTRIRSGQSVEDVARAAGIPVERVEPYAAPVLAEREHVAGLAQKSTVRRRGETSGHRKLQVALAERLGARGIDASSIRWDSARTDDGRWAVSAAYESGESHREAVFLFDVAARFSVAGNDDARWVLGESSPAKGPQPGRRRPVAVAEPDETPDEVSATEPTLDLSDELALVRATQPDPEPPPVPEPVPEPVAEPVAEPEPQVAADPRPAVPPVSQMDTFYEMLDGYAEDSVVVYRGLDQPGGWEPEIVVKHPLVDAGPDVGPEDAPSDDTSEEEQKEWQGAPDEGTPQSPLESDPAAIPDTTGVPEAPAEEDAVPDLPGEPEPEAVQAQPAVKKPAARKKKRASVPSWDEIMFGGPKPG